MKLAFAAGDVGGARALLPVAKLAAESGLEISAMKHGPFYDEGSKNWNWVDASVFHDQGYWHHRKCALVYATSVSDYAAFQAAALAQSANCPIVHVLDNWSNYGVRLRGPKNMEVIPDRYLVMDDVAYLGALEDGVPERILRILGHPGLEKLSEENLAFRRLGKTDLYQLLFVSEPVLKDQGAVDSSSYRGYDEVEVSTLFAKKLAECGDFPKKSVVWVLPHPRENRFDVERRWDRLANDFNLNFEVLSPDRVRAALHSADAVFGMTSILLYEAWLLGHPVVSIQPNLKRKDMSAINRDGVIFCTDPEATEFAINRVYSDLCATIRNHKSIERTSMHKNSSKKILDEILALGLARKNFDSI